MLKFVIAAAAFAVAACSPPQAPVPETGASEASRAITDPAVVVRQLYDRYLTADAVFPALLDSAPWSDQMRGELNSMMARSEAMGEPILDFDPVINAQDYQITEVVVMTDAVVENSHATARASFVNAGAPSEVVYDLIWQGDRWKVDNIRTSDWDLRTIARGP